MEHSVAAGTVEEIVVSAFRSNDGLTFDQVMRSIVGGRGSPMQRSQVRSAIVRLQERGVVRSMPVRYEIAAGSLAIKRATDAWSNRQEARDFIIECLSKEAIGVCGVLAKFGADDTPVNRRIVQRAFNDLLRGGVIERVAITSNKWAVYRLVEKA
jgi:hypothetical protein